MTAFDDILDLDEYTNKYGVEVYNNITGRALYNFTDVYILPDDQCSLINKQLCNSGFTERLCASFDHSSPYLCETDESANVASLIFLSMGIGGFISWFVLFIFLVYSQCVSKEQIEFKKN
eukprot:UN29289